MVGSRSAYTRKQILDAAATLFALKGHENTSLREVTAEAGVNLSSVSYHFGSKQGLVQAVYQEQLNALDRERLLRLEALEAGHETLPPDAASLADAFFRPLIAHALSQVMSSPSQASIFDGPAGDSNAFVRAMILSGHAVMMRRYQAAFARALPHIPERELLWRFQFMLGAACWALSGMNGLLLAVDRAELDPTDAERLIQRLLAFLLGGLLAPAPRDTGNDTLTPLFGV